MIQKLIKNPIFIAIIAAIIIFALIFWKIKNSANTDEEKKGKYIKGVIISTIIGIVVWFIGSTYLDTSDVAVIKNEIGSKVVATSISDSDNYHYISKNKIRTPPNDVFLDIAPF